MGTWWEIIRRLKPFNYGKDTGAWNRAKVLGAISTFQAIADIHGEAYAMWLMQSIPAQTVLDRLNDDKTADKITLTEE